MNKELKYKIAELLGYIEGAFKGKNDLAAKGLIERANKLARVAGEKEIGMELCS